MCAISVHGHSRGWLERNVISKVEPQASGALKEARPYLTVCADSARQACLLLCPVILSDLFWKANSLSDFRLSQKTEPLIGWGEADS